MRVCFLFNAQRHQLLHGISTAVHLARREDCEVHLASPSGRHLDYASRMASRLGGADIRYHRIDSPLLSLSLMLTGGEIPPKLLTLLTAARYLDGFDAVAAPERTSLLLRRMGVKRPRFIHLDHGAGDRAAGFDHRIAGFDMVLMAGEKHRVRLLRERLIRKDHYAVVGYPKFDAADAVRDPDWRPFTDDRPVVLYNPHFSALGSWDRFGPEVLRSFAAQDRYNLIVAPHVRLLDGRAAAARWAGLLAKYANHPRIHIDTGSDRSIDMTYTALADVYLGDVSSQIYEFLRTPRPCLFLDGRGLDWRGDKSYAHWRFGPVLDTAADLVDGVDAARRNHPDFLAEQVAGFAETFATAPESASERAAGAIESFMRGAGR
ncbi:MAG: hypothetical protein KKA16_05975 [Alphaproteobacteria bacterium]|nr:hypothetical protein [Alphaproteobacteria bacterium]MBU2380397.1 hypothetical protein [Alphaproteobacteria bacterium]